MRSSMKLAWLLTIMLPGGTRTSTTKNVIEMVPFKRSCSMYISGHEAYSPHESRASDVGRSILTGFDAYANRKCHTSSLGNCCVVNRISILSPTSGFPRRSGREAVSENIGRRKGMACGQSNVTLVFKARLSYSVHSRYGLGNEHPKDSRGSIVNDCSAASNFTMHATRVGFSLLFLANPAPVCGFHKRLRPETPPAASH